MKTKSSILLLIFCFLNLALYAQEKTSKEIKAEQTLKKQKEIEALIDSKKFDFEAEKVTPQGGRLIFIDYNTYFLKFNPEKTTCDLPFFGRAFSVPYGGDGGMKFEGVPENIKVEKKEKELYIKCHCKRQRRCV